MNTANDKPNQLEPIPDSNTKNGNEDSISASDMTMLIERGCQAFGIIQKNASEIEAAKQKTVSRLWVLSSLLIFATSWLLIWHSQYAPAVGLISHIAALVAGYFAGANKR